MALIEVEHLTKVYHMGDYEVHALKGVSVVVEAGDFVAIMGSSGSGKSTFMTILGGLDRPTAGEYRLDGIDMQTLSRDGLAAVRNKKIGFVFQSFNLLARTSALENVELPLLYGGRVPARERHARAMEALERVGLADRADHHPSQLSGGQQQRVAIARALVNRPTIVLADEPTGNLDSKRTVEVMALMQALNDAGITIILVTHEPDVAQFSKRKVILKDGEILTDEKVAGRILASSAPEASKHKLEVG
jgi:putative ABC transport system ATP-binding protein